VDLRSETAALVALLRTGQRPPHAYSELVEDAGSALAILEAEQGLLAGQLHEAAATEVAHWTEQGMRLLTVLHPNYPENLRAVHDRPPLIFGAGAVEQADSRSVAVIGTRKPTAGGVAWASAISEHLVEGDYTVVSGLASGIDTTAHTAALSNQGRTIAVIGTGLRRSYPAENAALQREIANGCAVISQFWPDAAPTRQSFPLRNALMSGLALATVVVEATRTSGARIQARLALAHGRPVLLAKSLLEQQWARELAARPGTHVIHTPAEITAVVERLTSADALVA
jgi:DNA processing protein